MVNPLALMNGEAEGWAGLGVGGFGYSAKQTNSVNLVLQSVHYTYTLVGSILVPQGGVLCLNLSTGQEATQITLTKPPYNITFAS